MDNKERYSYNKYIELLSKDEVVANDDESPTTIRMVGLNINRPTSDFQDTSEIFK